MMKRTKYHFSKEDICNMINKAQNKEFKPEQVRMGSKGLVVCCDEEETEETKNE